MNHNILFYALIFLLNFVIPNADARTTSCDGAQTDKYPGILYSIKGKTSVTSYLFGTIHLGHCSLKELPSSTLLALSQSRKLYREVDMNSVALDDRSAGLLIFFPDGKTLRSTLSERAYKRLQAHYDLLALSTEMRDSKDKQTPNFAVSFIEQRSAGFNNSPSFDHLLEQFAFNASMEISGIETFAETTQGYLSISDEEWSAYVEEILDIALCSSCIKERTFLTENTVTRVRAGDTEGLFSMYSKFFSTRPAQAVTNQKIIFSRNQRMAEKISDVVKKGEPVFISIGALHLGGDIGVVQRLRNMGYSVEQIK